MGKCCCNKVLSTCPVSVIHMTSWLPRWNVASCWVSLSSVSTWALNVITESRCGDGCAWPAPYRAAPACAVLVLAPGVGAGGWLAALVGGCANGGGGGGVVGGAAGGGGAGWVEGPGSEGAVGAAARCDRVTGPAVRLAAAGVPPRCWQAAVPGARLWRELAAARCWRCGMVGRVGERRRRGLVPVGCTACLRRVALSCGESPPG